MDYKEMVSNLFEEYGDTKGIEFDYVDREFFSMIAHLCDKAFKDGIKTALNDKRVEYFRELDPKQKDELKELKFIIGQQCCPNPQAIDILQNLARSEDSSAMRLLDCYYYGVMVGKRIERKKRKGGKVDA